MEYPFSAIKWFHALLHITKNSIKYQSFVYTQLNDQTVLFLTIQFDMPKNPTKPNIVYLIYMDKKYLTLNNLQWLICHKNKSNETKSTFEEFQSSTFLNGPINYQQSLEIARSYTWMKNESFIMMHGHHIVFFRTFQNITESGQNNSILKNANTKCHIKKKLICHKVILFHNFFV